MVCCTSEFEFEEERASEGTGVLVFAERLETVQKDAAAGGGWVDCGAEEFTAVELVDTEVELELTGGLLDEPEGEVPSATTFACEPSS